MIWHPHRFLGVTRAVTGQLCRSSRNYHSRPSNKEAKDCIQCCRQGAANGGRTSKLRRLRELQLQIDTEKQANVKLRRLAELQAATARQDDLELAQQEKILKRRQLMWNAQADSALTAQAVSAPTPNQDVKLSDTPFTLEIQKSAVLSVSDTAEDSTVPAAQPSKVKKVLKNPDMFKAQTVDGRDKEWVDTGEYADIKSQLVMDKKWVGSESNRAQQLSSGQSQEEETLT